MELSHTLEVEPNLFYRAFIKFYDLGANPDLDTCRLFWGTIGMAVLPPLMLAFSPVILILWVLTTLSDKVNESRSRKRAAYWALSYEERRALDNPPKSSRAESLEKFAAWAGAVWFKVQTPVTWIFRILLGGAALAGLVALVIVLVNVLPGLPWGVILSIAWQSVLGALGICALGFLLVKTYEAWRKKHPVKPKPKRSKKPSVIKAVFDSIHDHTCAKVKIVSK